MGAPALVDGAAEQAARLLGVVDGLCGGALGPALVDTARAALGAPAYEAAYATGASLDRAAALVVLTGAS